MWDYKSSLLDFMEHRNLYYIANLGKGTYGRVFHVKNRKNKSFAAKLVPKISVSLHELESWKDFDHPNVLKLLNVDASGEETVIFTMDFMAMSLNSYITNTANLQKEISFKKSRRFLREILSGLNYLHGMKFCHLDLTSSNVFISVGEVAKIGDFSGLAKAHEKKKNCPLPIKFWPPELYGNPRKAWPLPIDLWAYGLLSIQTMVGYHFFVCLIEDSDYNWDMWITDLKEKSPIPNFILRTYTSSLISEAMINDFTDFILQFLVMNPKKRLSAHQGLDHRFLEDI